VIGPRSVRWQDWEGCATGLEHCTLRPEDGRLVASGIVAGMRDRAPFGLFYRLAIDESWRLREALAATTDGARRVLTANGEGAWTLDGEPAPALAGAIDIDIQATPFTNTLPIRRLALAEGASAAIRVAYLTVPELTLLPAEQRYTCLQDSRLHRFEALETGFAAELSVDPDGLVTDYPGLFRRLA
jgi:hypothetical protein